MSNYHQLAVQDLDAAGITVDSLIEQYPQELLRFKLACDMGMTDSELQPDEEGSHLLNNAARAWIELAMTWPPQEAIAGITVPVLARAIFFQINEGVDVLAQLPPSHHSEDVRLVAVSKNGWAIRHINASVQSDAVRLAAVHNKGYAIRHIPVESRSEALLLAAVRQDAYALCQIPIHQQSEAVRLATVQKNGHCIRYIPVCEQSENVRLVAVQQYGRALQHIPFDQQDKAIRLAALRSDPYSSHYMPYEIAKKLLAELKADAGAAS
jgi:hypothetical protein